MKNINGILKDIIELIKDNKEIFNKLIIADKKISGFELDISKLIEYIESYKNFEIKNQVKRKILINHYGNPYITAKLCIEAICNNNDLIIGINDICYGLNKAIVKIVNDTLEEYRINIKIEVINSIILEEFNNLDKVICLGDSNSYMEFRKNSNNIVEYVPLFDINLYYDSENFEEVVETIRRIAIQNFYEIEIFDDTEEFEDVIYIINKGLEKNCSVILSNDKAKQIQFKKEINSQIICINENPFNKFKLAIPQQIWN